MEIESEQKIEENAVPSAENVGQEQPSSDESKQVEGDQSKIDDVSVAADSGIGESAPVTEQKTEVGDEKKAEDSKIEDSQAKVMDGEDDTTVDEIDSDFDNIEDIDPSYEIEANLWKPITSFDEVDLKPPRAEPKEGEEPKKKKEDEGAAEVDSEYADFYKIRTEKEKDDDFQEYIRELRRPMIVSYLPDCVVPKGTNVRLTCTVQGNNIQTRWTKNDEPLERGKRVTTKSDGEIHIFEIPEITEKENGVYTAYFKNRAGEVETSTRVRVFDGSLHKPDHLDIALVKGEHKLLIQWSSTIKFKITRMHSNVPNSIILIFYFYISKFYSFRLLRSSVGWCGN